MQGSFDCVAVRYAGDNFAQDDKRYGFAKSIYNASMPETKPFRLTESVKAAG